MWSAMRCPRCARDCCVRFPVTGQRLSKQHEHSALLSSGVSCDARLRSTLDQGSLISSSHEWHTVSGQSYLVVTQCLCV